MKYTKTQLADIVEWDKENWKKAIMFFESRIDFNTIDSCLELGARRGGLSLWLALNGRKNILCTDYVDNTEVASICHQAHGIDYISYGQINAVEFNEKEKYDLICFKSMLGAVGYNDNKEAQKIALENIYNALKPGGLLVFTENLSGSWLHMFLRRTFIKWGNRWRYMKLNELIEMTSMFSDVQYETYGFLGTMGRNEKQRCFLGKIDSVLCLFLPAKMKYISMFVCRK